MQLFNSCFRFAAVILSIAHFCKSETPFCNQYVRSAGFQCREYTVTTPDGFILHLQRVGASGISTRVSPETTIKQPDATSHVGAVRRDGASAPAPAIAPPSKKFPVIIDHAMFIGADVWFTVLGKKSDVSLPFLLAEKGFDVWLINHRGTQYSPDHVSYTREDWQFWDWSFDELASIDLPAIIPYVLSESKQAKLHFIGYDQGATLPVCLFSESPASANQIASATLIAPIAYLANVTSAALRFWGNPFTPDEAIYQYHIISGLFNISNTGLVDGIFAAANSTFLYRLGGATDLVNNITGPSCCIDFDRFRDESISKIDPNWLVSPYRNLNHYQQEISIGQFQKFRAPTVQQNQQLCRSDTPPLYRPQNVPTGMKILVISGANDWFADPPNIDRLMSELPLGTKQIVVPNYSHLDLLFGNTSRNQVYDRVISYISSGYLT